MITISASLLAATQSRTSVPTVQARLRNRHICGVHRLIWSPVYSGPENAGPVATVVTVAGT